MAQSRADYLAAHLRPPGLQVAAALQAQTAVRRLRGRRRELLVAPARLQLPETLWKIVRMLGLRSVGQRSLRVVAAVHWTLDTRTAPAPGMVNGDCTDISKHRVEAAMRAAFGYGIAVEPTHATGRLVRKSDANARHDGTVVTAPVGRAEPGAVYQRLIPTGRPDMLEELRVPVVGDLLPGVYVKRRPPEDRFGRGPSAVLLARPEAVLDAPERAGILALARDMRLDFGELDVLRDRHDGRIHVVDVNRTPWGPPRSLGTREALRAVRMLASAFEASFL